MTKLEMHIYVHPLTINYRLTLCGCGRKKKSIFPLQKALWSAACSNKDRGECFRQHVCVRFVSNKAHVRGHLLKPDNVLLLQLNLKRRKQKLDKGAWFAFVSALKYQWQIPKQTRAHPKLKTHHIPDCAVKKALIPEQKWSEVPSLYEHRTSHNCKKYNADVWTGSSSVDHWPLVVFALAEIKLICYSSPL